MYGSKLERSNSTREGPSNTNASLLPPLLDYSPYNRENQITIFDFSHVLNSFTNPNQIEKPKTQDDNIVHNNETSIMNILSSSKQMDVCPLDEATIANSNQITLVGNSSNFFFSQAFSFGRDMDADIASLVYGNDMFQRWSGNQDLSPASIGLAANDSFWNF